MFMSNLRILLVATQIRPTVLLKSSYPLWGAADAEIMFRSADNPELSQVASLTSRIG